MWKYQDKNLKRSDGTCSNTDMFNVILKSFSFFIWTVHNKEITNKLGPTRSLHGWRSTVFLFFCISKGDHAYVCPLRVKLIRYFLLIKSSFCESVQISIVLTTDLKKKKDSLLYIYKPLKDIICIRPFEFFQIFYIHYIEDNSDW